MKNHIYLLIILLMACNPLRHWKGVAVDADVTMQKKAIIAPMVALHFPPETKYIKGDTVIKVIIDTLVDIDTTYLPGDTITKIITKLRERTIVKTVIDTVYQLNTAEVFALREHISKQEQLLNELIAKSQELKDDADDAHRSRRWWVFGFFLLAAFNLFVLYKWITR